MLYEAAQILLTQWLKAGTRGSRNGEASTAPFFAVSRRLAVNLNRLWTNGTDFRWGSEPAAAID